MERTSDDEPDLLDVTEAAALLGVSERTVWRYSGTDLHFRNVPVPITRQHPVKKVPRTEVLALKARREGEGSSEVQV